MKVKKETTVDIDDALNSLHLTNPPRKKRRRLSGIHGAGRDNTVIEESIDNDDSNQEPDIVVRKSNRKKSIPVRWNPQDYVAKTSTSNTVNPDNIMDYYLKQSAVYKPTPLETIHEESSNLNRTMSNRKFRRFLQFDKVTNSKIKRRRDKAQKLKVNKKTIKATIEDLHKKLKLIEEDC